MTPIHVGLFVCMLTRYT